MQKPYRIALADDHPLYLEGLEILLNKSGEAKVVATAKDGDEAIAMMEKTKADLLLLDLHLPGRNGIEVAEALSRNHSAVKIVMLTMQRGGRYVDKLRKLGVRGYLLKSVSLDELLDAVRKVMSGGEHFSEDIIRYDHEENMRLKSSAIVDDSPGTLLTAREREILVLVCKEFSSAEIGKKLFISTGTVDTHRKNILIKLGVGNTVGLVKYALKHGLLDENTGIPD
ncbi:MAG TPA: response regulator transcription factor [Bacteroidia bacterium]|nr:response regulator transcription factor [Bacteroidia bacterium]